MDNQNINLGNWFVDQLNLYQSANSDKESIKRNFIIRKSEFELIIRSLKNKKAKDPLQHELILGRRGSGKSTLLKRIQIEIDENFNEQYLAINLAEEQAGIYRLFDLWIEVINELEYKLEREIKLEEYSKFKTDQDFTRYLYHIINEICTKEKKKIILLLDNFDRIVENFSDDGHLLREFLINYNDIQIIAGSTRMDEHFWKYDKPFYEFFRRYRLESLTSEEINLLINHWAETLKIDQLKNFAENNRGKIENIRILTDGSPRTLQLFIQILLQNSQLYGYDYLRKVMDNVTPLYQERLNHLTPQLRKIVSEIAFIWEACTTKQLVEKCRMESKLISANLKTLVDKGIVDKIETPKKNHLYRISERFFNMWLIITQGNPDQKRKAKWLSIFLENWYDANDFRKLTNDHIHNLEGKKLGYNQALLFSKALSQCKYVSTFDRDKIIDLTEKLDDNLDKNRLIELPKKYSEIEKQILSFQQNKEYVKAIKLIEEVENEKDGVKFALLADQFYYLNNHKSCEINLLKSIKNGDKGSLYNLASLYQEQNKFDLAEKYYLEAVKNNINNSYFNLATIHHEKNNFENAEKFYKISIKTINDVASVFNLATLYGEYDKFELAEKYYLLAIKKGDFSSINNLSNLYYFQNKNKVKSFELIKKYNEKYEDNISIQPQIIIEIWNGIFDKLEDRLIDNFKSHNLENLQTILSQLLIQNQKNLILKLFQNQEIGKELQDKYSILYYVTLLLNNSKEENLELKIPPEIKETVNNILEQIKERQVFYGY